MSITIRPVEPVDYPHVTSLLVNELWDHHYNGDHVATFLDSTMDKEDDHTFVALLDGQVVGVISVFVLYWATREQPNTLFIQGLAVKKQYQNQGIGTKLLRYVETFGKAHKIAYVGLNSGVHRVAAHAFYERNGYAKGSFSFGKRIVEEVGV